MNLPNPLAETPSPPFYAVIFTSQRSAEEESGYAEMAERMTELAAQQDGFLGVESVREEVGTGITVSYWRDRESIQRWRKVTEHMVAQEHGRSRWYQRYHVRICLVEHQYGFDSL
ncbi:MAG TPA: antibiotic biosynthesis monooxygenase [Fuerstia sp.]|nr:antibiotic biosynthesis monooxygenase [Fuerstiella sp.]